MFGNIVLATEILANIVHFFTNPVFRISDPFIVLAIDILLIILGNIVHFSTNSGFRISDPSVVLAIEILAKYSSFYY